jgi:hypothetical protein
LAFHEVKYGPGATEVKKKPKLKKKDLFAQRTRFHKSICETVLEAARLRGSLTLSEMKMVAGKDHPALKKASKGFWSCVIKENLLPFQALFYRALRDRDFDRAEFVKKTWLEWLKKIEYAEPKLAKAKISRLETFVIPDGNKRSLKLLKVSIH